MRLLAMALWLCIPLDCASSFLPAPIANVVPVIEPCRLFRRSYFLPPSSSLSLSELTRL
jgi:hypothetical protein